MIFSVDEYQNFECSRLPNSDLLRVTHLPTGITLTEVPQTQDMERGHRYWLFQSGPEADWKAQLIQGGGLFQGNVGHLREDRAKALGLPFETPEDRLSFSRNIGTWHALSHAIACDGRPLPPWTEELVTILLQCKIVASSTTEWHDKTAPRPQEIVFQVHGAPAHLQGMNLIVRYKDR